MTERWHTVEASPDIFLVQNGDTLVGSIARIDPAMPAPWCVEILWLGPTGDIKGQFSEHACALSFVEGVEKTLIALGIADPKLAARVHGEKK